MEETEDSDAISKSSKTGEVTVENAYGGFVTYDLIYDPGKTYGKEYIAFVKGGNGHPNLQYDKAILEIDARITHDGQKYEVVGLRNNAFKANETGSKTIAITKVILPETIQVIGATVDYMPDEYGNGGYVFGNCENLTELVIKGTNPRLEKIAPGAFFNTRLVSLDLSECHDLTTLMLSSFSKIPTLKLVDIRNVTNVKSLAFNESNIQSIIMPTSATISQDAFKGMVIKDFDGTVIYDYDSGITDTSVLCGKMFAKVGGEYKRGYLATFNTNSANTMDRMVLAPGQEIPDPPTGIRDSTTNTFWKWTLDNKDGADATVMPENDQLFYANWTVKIPDGVEVTYDSTYHEPYSHNDGYTVVSGGEAKWVGTNHVTLRLTEGTVWEDYTTDDKVIDWSIKPKPVRITGIIAEDKVYDGTTAATLDFSHAIFHDLENGDSLTVTATGVFTDASAGHDKTVLISDFVLGGSLADQYEVAALGNQADALADISKKIITVRVHSNSKTFGDPDPDPISTWEWENAIVPIAGDVTGVTLTRVAGEDWGPHWINFTVVWTSDDKANNYTVLGAPGEFTIERKHIKVVADDKNIEYGQADPTFTYSMFTLDDTPIVVPVTFDITFTRETGTDVGSYEVTPHGNGDEGNYVFSYIPGTLYIINTGANVIAPTIHLVYGEAVPTSFTATFIGLPDGYVDVEFSHGEITNVGVYDLIVTGPAHKDPYDITYVKGKIIVSPKVINVIADDKEKIYGEADPALTYTVKDHSTGETLDIKNLLTITLTRAEGEDFGKYRITPSGDIFQGNYEIKFDFGAFDIKRKTINIYPNEIVKYYGDADPELTATIDGLVGSDTVVYTLTRVAGENVDVYDISSEGEIQQGNYIVKFHTGDFIIDYRTVTIDADDLYKVYGNADPELTAVVTGLLEGDAVEYTLTRAEGEDYGTYEVTASGHAFQGNYRLVFVSGSLTIEPGVYDITIIIVGKGTVESTIYRCIPGTDVTLTINPAQGWSLKTVESEQVEIDSNNTFTMGHNDVVVTVTFEKESEPVVVLTPVIAIAALAGLLMVGFLIPKH